jgi:hypothetical protein
MADATADSRVMLDAVADAYATGDTARAEILLTDALDQGAPWDEVTTAAARGIYRYRNGAVLDGLPAPI